MSVIPPNSPPERDFPVAKNFVRSVCLASVLSFSCMATAPRPTQLPFKETVERVAKTLSLRQAIHAATTLHPAIKSANISVDISEISEKAAWSGFLPTVGITANVYGDKTSGTSQFDTAITGNQYLIGFAGPRQKAAQANIDTKIAALSKDVTVQQRRAMAEDVFLQTWLKQEEHTLWEKQFAASSEALKLKKRLHDTGLLTDADYESAISQTADIETSLASNKDELQALISELEDITGYTLSDDNGVFCKLNWQPEVDIPLQPLSFYISTALELRLELELNKAARERALADEKFAAGKILPTLSATGQYTFGYAPGSTPTDPTLAAEGSTKNSFFAGLQASWNILDASQSKLEAEAARARALKSSTDREISKKKITKEVKKIHSDLKIAQKRTRALEAQLRASQEGLKLSQALNLTGMNTEADLCAADASSYKTQFSCLSQVVNFQRSYFALNAACGYGLDTVTT